MVKNCTIGYSILFVYPAVRFFHILRSGILKIATSTSSLYVVKPARRSPDGDGIGEISSLSDTSVLIRNGSPYSIGSPLATSAGRYCLRSHVRKCVLNSSGVTSSARFTALSTLLPRV